MSADLGKSDVAQLMDRLPSVSLFVLRMTFHPALWSRLSRRQSSSCCFHVVWHPPSTSMASLRLGQAKSTVMANLSTGYSTSGSWLWSPSHRATLRCCDVARRKLKSRLDFHQHSSSSPVPISARSAIESSTRSSVPCIRRLTQTSCVICPGRGSRAGPGESEQLPGD